MAEDFQIGDIVDVQGQRATVRFVGETEFADGEWIGVELDMPTGKNNGTVKDVKYFTCRDRYGMFVRDYVPRLIDRPKRAPPRVAPSPAPKRMSVTSPPPSAASKVRSMTMRSPTKPASPTKGLISGSTPSSSGPSTPRTTTPTVNQRTSLRPTPVRPGSMGPPPLKTGGSKRQSISSTPPSRSSTSTPSNARPGSNRLSLKPAAVSALSNTRRVASQSVSGGSPSEMRRNRTDTISETSSGPSRVRPGITRRDSLAPGDRNTSSTSPSRGGASQRSPSVNAELAASHREVEDLKSKIKILEKKRLEDRENLKTLERVREEKEKYEGIIQKLQTKYQPIQHENQELRKQVKEIEVALGLMEEAKAEDDMQLEMAALDREMAEEQAEAYKSELEAVRAKAEEFEMELEILREENAELSQGMSPEEKTSAGWLQLEKQNERLKEALLRLREITTQTEEQLRDDIKSLQEDNGELQKYKDEYEDIRAKLLNSESAVEDLRQQLETALGAEEMLEELTQQNMSMGEQLDELRATVEDLESLKEISDELEINHVESEKQMQEELDYRDLVIAEQAKRIQQLDANNEEAEYTITRFRELVTSLQSDLEDMKASQQITETEAQALTERSRSMMDINMKLQITAAKAQNKTIDLELRRMEAQEAMEHLAIVQLFLPDSFHADRESVLALLRFRRVEFKAQLLQSFVKERISGQFGTHEESVMAACDVTDKLTWVSAMCERFVSCISSCSTQQFSRFQGALYELDPVERALDGWIKGLRSDELKEKQCAAELQRSMALMSHLGEIHLKNDLEGFASDMNMRTLLMQSYMESLAAALSHVKLMVQDKLPAASAEDTSTDVEDPSIAFHKKLDGVISHSRNAKVVVSKILRSLDDFRSRSLSLTQDHRHAFESAEETCAKLAAYARYLGEEIYMQLFDTADPPTWPTVTSSVFRITESKLLAAESELFSALSKELKNLSSNLLDLASVASDIDSTAEFERQPAPWSIRAQEIRATKITSIDTDEEIRRLKDALLERATQIKLRDQSLEESSVKIELLESRMQNVAKQQTRIKELETHLSAAEGREKALEEAVESLNEEIEQHEIAIQKLKIQAQNATTNTAAVRAPSNANAEPSAATACELAALKAELTALRNAVSHYRAELNALRAHDATAPGGWLDTPLFDPARRAHKKRVSAIRREAMEIMAELQVLVVEEKVVNLAGRSGEERMRWRPKRETARWWVERQRERYEAVRSWKEELMARVEGRESATVVGSGVEEGVVAAGVRLEKGVVEGLRGGGVVVREPEEWEGVLEVLGVE